jgi:hypothetical protein
MQRISLFTQHVFLHRVRCNSAGALLLILCCITYKVYRTVIIPVVYGCETWSVTLKDGRRLRVLRILGTNRDKVRGEWRRLCNWELHDLYSSPHIIWWPNQTGWDGMDMWHPWATKELHAGLWWGNLRERDNVEDLGVDGRIILKWVFRK